MIELSFNVYTLLISIAFIIAMTFGILLLFSRRESKKADRFLAALMFILAAWNTSILTLSLNLYQYAAGIIWIPLTFTLALGPCFYFYIRFVTDFELTEKPKIWPHFIPVIFEVLLFLIEVFQGLPQGIGYFQTTVYLFSAPIVDVLAILSFMIYGYWSRKRIQTYHHWVHNNYSHSHRYNLNWLHRLSSIFLYFSTVWLCYFLIDFVLFDYQLSFVEYYPFHLILAGILIWLSVEAFLKPAIVYPDQVPEINSKDKKIALPDEELQEKATWLNDQIKQNLLYLDPELSLRSLAKTLDIHPNLVSKIINEGLKQTFSDCINSYRVKAVIDKLKDEKNEKATFLAIAFECGFNSKTTFNRVFKKETGQTPLQFKKNLIEQ